VSSKWQWLIIVLIKIIRGKLITTDNNYHQDLNLKCYVNTNKCNKICQFIL